MMFTSLLLIPAFFLIAAHGTALEPRACNTYTIAGVSGGFTKKVSIDFSSVSGGNAATFLQQNGLQISSYPITDTPFSRNFLPSNVALGSGTLDLKVSAFSGTGSVQSAEVVTADSFLYGSVRTVQKSSSVPGVCEGNFAYLNDNNEVDFEILTSTTLQSNLACVPAGSWVTNHGATAKTSKTIPFTFDPSAAFHEYRVDWTPSATMFYIDGVKKATITANVPTLAAPWVWNAWSNGDECWSNGPPTSDSVTHIRSVEIYKGYTSTISGTTCSI